MITLDTSGVFALLNGKDPDHGRVTKALRSDPGPYLIPAGILAEVGFLVEQRLGVKVLDRFLEDLSSGAFTLDCGPEDFARIRELVLRYSDMPLGFADASVAACAERNGGLVMTLDQRHFSILAREGHLRLIP